MINPAEQQMSSEIDALHLQVDSLRFDARSLRMLSAGTVLVGGYALMSMGKPIDSESLTILSVGVAGAVTVFELLRRQVNGDIRQVVDKMNDVYYNWTLAVDAEEQSSRRDLSVQTSRLV